MDVSLKLEISSRAWIFSDDPFVNPCVDPCNLCPSLDILASASACCRPPGWEKQCSGLHVQVVHTEAETLRHFRTHCFGL